MHEFSSISVSSYDAASLSDRLTQQSADGWDVVAIVPAGTNVVAYLSRHTDTMPMIAEPADDQHGSDDHDHHDHGDHDHGDHDHGDHDHGGSTDESDAAPSSGDFSFSLASATSPEAAAAETALADEAPAPEPVEPSGWASEPAPTPTPEPEPAMADSTMIIQPHQPVEQAAAEQPAQSEPAQAEQQPAASGAAPAGWYADPAGRFELRYWDGAQWTEHVSRAGQQYTDPPVA